MKKLCLIICFAMVSGFAQAQWTLQKPLPTGNNLNSVFFPDANTGYAAGDSGTIIKTNNGGTTWDTLSSGTTLQLNSVYFIDANTGYAVGGEDWVSNGIILKTSNGGTKWDALSSGTVTPFNSVFFTDSDTGYVVGEDNGGGIILKTIDGGTTLTEQPSDFGWRLNSVFFNNDTIGYAVGPYGIIIKTIDGGAIWDHRGFGYLNYYFSSIYFTNSDTGYAVGGQCNEDRPCVPLIIKTTDGGISWTILLSREISNLKKLGILRSIFFTNTNIGYAVGGGDMWGGKGQIIIKTIDAGTTWHNLSSLSSSTLNSVFFTDSNTGYAVGDSGTILKTTNGGGLVSIKEIQTHQSTFTTYPNPATNKITITTPGKSQGETQVSIFSINGRLIQRDKFLNQDRFEMDVSTVAKGIYLLRIQSVEGVETQKLMIQ